jgi:hypothetical protein
MAAPSPLASYVTARGKPRAIYAEPGAVGSVLVVDRDAVSGEDARLIAHLAPDEPLANARLVCRHYLAAPRGCRALRPEDLETAPVTLPEPEEPLQDVQPVRAASGTGFQLIEIVTAAGPPPELRWSLADGKVSPSKAIVVSMRRAIATVEDYEPIRTLTCAAIARHRRDRNVSITTLSCELRRVTTSPIVLNRLLRETVLGFIDESGMSMSAIAMRCGRIKRDRRGNVSGETSWLARRIGLLPEGGASVPTPWVHSDVLALIARRGLGVDPREVELG